MAAILAEAGMGMGGLRGRQVGKPNIPSTGLAKNCGPFLGVPQYIRVYIRAPDCWKLTYQPWAKLLARGRATSRSTSGLEQGSWEPGFLLGFGGCNSDFLRT